MTAIHVQRVWSLLRWLDLRRDLGVDHELTRRMEIAVREWNFLECIRAAAEAKALAQLRVVGGWIQ